jgi:ParB family chromosome partitioning protein
MARRQFGKDLEALMSVTKEGMLVEKNFSSIQYISIAQLKISPYQPRKQFNEVALKELADSIREQGILQPIVAREKGKYYEIIAGERRWRAAKMVGFTSIPVITQDIDDATALAFALIENIQRQDLTPLEEAEAMQRLLVEFSMTHEAVAKKVGRSRTAVTNILRLLKLSNPVKDYLSSGKIEQGHARALLSLSDQEQESLVVEVIEKKLSVRQTEQLIQRIKKRILKPAPDQNIYDKDHKVLDELKDILTNQLSAMVDINFNSKNKKGKVIVHFEGLDELKDIIANTWPT